MKRSIPSLLLFAGLMMLTCAQMNDTKITTDLGKSSDSRWQKVDSLENKGLYRSAWDVVDEIYADAAKGKAYQIQYRALCYQLRYSRLVEEKSEKEAIQRLEGVAEQGDHIIAALSHSLLAKTYWRYYQDDRYRILQRTVNTDPSADMAFWDAKTFIERVHHHFTESLREKDVLKSVATSSLDPVLLSTQDNLEIRPRLFDLLAAQALEFYKDSNAGLSRPDDHFRIDDDRHFARASDFAALDIPTKDSLSFDLNALLLFQELLKEQEIDSDAYLYTDLQRLLFVDSRYSRSGPGQADGHEQLFEAIGAAKEGVDSPVISEYDYHRARLLHDRAAEYALGARPERKEDHVKALEICTATIASYPDSRGASLCRSLQQSIEQKQIVFRAEEVTTPGRATPLLLDYRNIDALHLRLIRAGEEKDDERYRDVETELRRLAKETPVHEWSHSLPSSDDHQQHTTETVLPALEPGRYALLGSSDEGFKVGTGAMIHAYFYATDIQPISRSLADGRMSIRLLDRTTAAPLKGAQVTYRYVEQGRDRNFRSDGPFTADKDGAVIIPYYDRRYSPSYLVEHQGQEYRFRAWNRGPQNKGNAYRSAHFFTDRSIYRPGQTVHFKTILLEVTGNESKILPNTSVDISLRDANYQEVGTLSLRTNEFGTCNGTFTLPTSGLTGQMSLVSAHGSTYFSVEEYKRPRFSVEMEPIKGEFKLGDDVQATGLAMGFNGAAVSDAEVTYTVTRSPRIRWPWYWWWRPFPQENPTVITTGTAETDEEGRFTIHFTATPGPSDADVDYYDFSISADVTDLNGETRSGSSSISIGDKAMLLDSPIQDEIQVDRLDSLPISVTNINGEGIQANGEWEILEFVGEVEAVKKRKWDIPQFQTIDEADFQESFPYMVYDRSDKEQSTETESRLKGEWAGMGSTAIPAESVNGLKAGRYLIRLRSTAKDGKEYTFEKPFTLYSLKDGEAVFDGSLKAFFTESSYRPGQRARLLVSSPWSDARVRIDIERDMRVVSSSDIELDRSQKIIDIPVITEDQEGVSVHLYLVKEGRVHSRQLQIPVEKVDRILDLSLETFRDKMLPGSKEEWRIKVSPRNGEKATSELLLGMYDASLDQFRAHDWMFSPRSGRYPILGIHAIGVGQVGSRIYAPSWYERGEQVRAWLLPSLLSFGYLDGNMYRYAEGAVLKRSSGSPIQDMVMNVAEESVESQAAPSPRAEADGLASMVDNESDDDMEANKPPTSVGTPSRDDPPAPQIRTDFNETAFFFPELRTDENGGMTFSFRMPESLTKWKFQALAHTKSLQVGAMSQEVITQKELMVLPNAPRFLRQGDEIVLSTKVTNLAGVDLSGSLKLELFDAMSMRPILPQSPQTFSVMKGKSTAFDWRITVPDSYDAITYRFVAQSEDHSDGEEAILPVLSDRMLVHEAMPFSLSKENSADLTFERMEVARRSSTLKERSLTLEFTGNPVWYAVQAMPYMMEYPYDCSEQIFTRYYANALAGSIISERPRLREVFERWRELDPESLLSNLEKSQDLKYVLLEETPWVLEAQDETARKNRLGLLLDLDHMADRQQRALGKLQQNQLASGAWPWFNGMRESIYITQHIISGLGHLKKLGALDDEPRIRQMIEPAIRYLDQEHLRRFKEMKRRNKDYLAGDNTGSFQIQYLYARSFFSDIPVQQREAYDYYLSQAAEYWLDDNIYLQGFNALAQHRVGDKSVATDIMGSIKERSIMSEDLGMYWKDYQKSWYWQNPGVEKHALMVEAFSEIMDDQEAVYGLKQWLIFNKQTNDWETTKATAEACYALLLGGSDWTQDRRSSVQVGSETFSSDSPSTAMEAGTGYIKKSWAAEEIKADMSRIHVEKEGEAPVWGALHWQYFEQMDKIGQSASPLQIRKSVHRVERTEEGERLTAIDGDGALEVGDRIRIRMEVETDREMEFVHIKDLRAASFEPVDVISGMVYAGGLGFYRSTRDASTNYFIDHLAKGTYVLEYDVFAGQAGDFSNGISSIQCMYAPEFTSHSEGIRVEVGQK